MTKTEQGTGVSFVGTLIRVFIVQVGTMALLWLLHSLYN